MTFNEDLTELIDGAIKTDKLKSSVVFYVFLQMLKNHQDNEELRNACCAYIKLVKSDKKKKQKQADIDWCNIIIAGLTDALHGVFNPIILPLKKNRDLIWYFGSLRHYIC